MQRVLIITTVCITAAFGCFGQQRTGPRRGEIVETIPAGTRISVRTDGPIDVRERSDGRIYTGSIAEDVYGPSNEMLIPRGAQVELIVQNLGDRQMSVDLDSISVNGRRYMADASVYRESRRSGVGANKRTGEYVGGGAVFGSIVGAIAGGGKGAAIGALAGAAAGGSAQVLTRGDRVWIPAESVLSFHLDSPLAVGTGRFANDNGYDENGYHYHNGYYDRGGGR